MDKMLLKNTRTKKGYSQSDISNMMGIAVASYNRKELGRREFTCSEVGKLIKILNLNNDRVMDIFFNN